MKVEWREERGQPPRVFLLRNGEEIRRVCTKIVPLKELSAIFAPSWDDFMHTLSLLEEKGAMRLAVASLARRFYHSLQLLKILKKHLLPEEIAKKVVSLCKEKGYLDDALWMEQRISSLRAQGKSSQDIAFRLKREGISPPSYLGKDEDVLAQLISKKYPLLLQKDISQKDQAKIIRALLRRGFSFQDIQKFLRNKSSLFDIEV